MPIIYSLVAMNKTILAEQAESKIKGNFQGVSKQIIEKMPPNKNTKVTYEYDAYVLTHAGGHTTAALAFINIYFNTCFLVTCSIFL